MHAKKTYKPIISFEPLTANWLQQTCPPAKRGWSHGALYDLLSPSHVAFVGTKGRI